ncbi:ABC transporter family protein (macronuclear) [Tetrahymena thermophila SB210]|uniref:ABC transporter family protein n=1 Tax=Tetrahymena thermophila (strain SB210) TaxID=312017 RepID=Q22D55_TETTS|nr:ABC transporter family protein [Tetrahymena thermophila SB210]EAR83198.2 ABC transporter family protein [Tetrahymena thermophila SB210]|eukprot:XP_001030861.2 ABC transporter family protein [Tetrahymena thermophila SB210]
MSKFDYEEYLQTQPQQYNLNISYNNICYYVNDGKKERKVLDNLSGTFKTGLNAIMGGSGSGKTSFLNVLAKKIDFKKHKVEGQSTINGLEYDQRLFQCFANYAQQDDILLPTLTVREYFEFASNLKLQHLSYEKRQQQVDKIINLLMLQKCQNTLIGDHINRGISGGEKKRVCIGIELIGNPKILFLDEPTSGLDSFTAFVIIKMLKKYAEEQSCVIIFTVHQPSSDIWELFDQVTFLCEGRFIYNGHRQNIKDYFEKQGFYFPILQNPADYIMSLVQSQNQLIQEKLLNTQQQQSDQLSNQLEQVNQDNTKEICKHKLDLLLKKQNFQNFTSVCKILIKRQLLNIKRNRILLKARFFQYLFTNLFYGLIYFNIGNKTESPQDVFQICKCILLLGLGCFFQSINPQTITFSSEKEVFMKEYNSQMYSALNYYLSKMLPEIILCSYFGLQVSLICFFMIGFEGSTSNFFFFALNFILITNIGNSVGILSSAMFQQSKVAISFIIGFLVPQVMFSGVYKNLNELPEYVSWCRYLTPIFYSNNAIINDLFSGKTMIYNPVEQLHFDLDKWVCQNCLDEIYQY